MDQQVLHHGPAPQNSLIRWIVDQGYTLFVVSWKNPDASYAESGSSSMSRRAISRRCACARDHRREKVNAIGYCIAARRWRSLALYEEPGEKPIKSATFFTTLTDFSDQGEFTVFLQDDFVDAIEREVAEARAICWTAITCPRRFPSCAPRTLSMDPPCAAT
jgi:polyhydroxyalkanoate synthase